MAFCGKQPVRLKIVLEETLLEQIFEFNYLDSVISIRYETGRRNYQSFRWCGIVRRILKNKTRITFYKTMTVSLLMYGCESWVPTRKILNRIQSLKMSFKNKTKGCTRLRSCVMKILRISYRDCPHMVQFRNTDWNGWNIWTYWRIGGYLK